jgi:hypothetical protein
MNILKYPVSREFRGRKYKLKRQFYEAKFSRGITRNIGRVLFEEAVKQGR